MTKSAKPKKIVLAAIQNIPFDQLLLSQANVRRVKAGLSIETLAEDIARRNLLQSLNVRPERDAEGQETGRFEVPAGGRRFRALELLVKQKRLAANAPVPCIVRDAGLAAEDSLAENSQRESLHPLDQFRAFAELRGKGLGEEEIAARFFVSVAIVRQRLKLAAASPKLLDLYVAEELSLEQLMAFCVTDDHARQEQVWDAVQRGYNKEPYLIRRLLTEDSVAASDRRAAFVGVAAYEAAGGMVVRDLFQQDRGGWLEDVALLERLVQEKLDAEAETVRGEGWRWVTAAADFPYGHTAGLRRIEGEAVAPTADEEQAQAALQAEYDALVAAHDEADELPDEVDVRLGELEVALEAFNDRPLAYDPAEMATAGAFVSIGMDGHLQVERGYVRGEDEAADGAGAEPTPGSSAAMSQGVSGNGAPANGAADPAATADEEDGLRPLPERLVTELTAHRTLALRDALANDPDAAFLALLHRLCLTLFRRPAGASCLEIEARSAGFAAQAPGLAATPPARAIEARHAGWEARLPRDPAALWAFLAGLAAGERMALLAHGVALTVNAVHEPLNRRPQALADADRLADAVGLDLVAAGWAPTAENYLGRVSKAHILAAVREAQGEPAAQLIDHLRKGDMAREAERLLAGTGWLPEPLRRAGAAVDAPEALPAFLADDGEGGDGGADPAAYAVAAE